jgi:small subunit ribosomal protein S6
MVSEKTTTTEKLNSYELTVILKPDLAEEKLEAVIENVKKQITGKGGVIQDAQKWGKRRLAYEINHNKEGVYILFRFQAKPANNRELEINLRISEDVLRHLLIKPA